MRRELMRKANLGAEMANETNQQNSERQVHGALSATDDRFPRPVRKLYRRFMHRHCQLRRAGGYIPETSRHFAV